MAQTPREADGFSVAPAALFIISMFTGWSQFAPNEFGYPELSSVYYSSPIGLGFGWGHTAWLIVVVMSIILVWLEVSKTGLNFPMEGLVLFKIAIYLIIGIIGFYILQKVNHWDRIYYHSVDAPVSFIAPSHKKLYVQDWDLGVGVGIWGLGMVISILDLANNMIYLGKKMTKYQ